MAEFWISVVLQIAFTTLLLAIALWALADGHRSRMLWLAERERRTNGSRSCTCGAYRQC